MAADRIVAGLAVLALVTGCGGGAPTQSPTTETPAGATSLTPSSSGEPPQPTTNQRLVLTATDDGRTITVPVTAAVIVRLATSTTASWSVLRAVGPALVVPVDYRIDPGYSEFEIRLTGKGTVLLESTCSGAGCVRFRFRVSLRI